MIYPGCHADRLSARNKRKKQYIPKLASSFFLLVLILCISGSSNPEQNAGWSAAQQILREIKPPVFPKRDFDISEFGAVGDGKSDCTGAIGRAIESCSVAGGGRVVIPKGTFLTGAIHLKSNVNLHLKKEAVLLFSRDTKKYLPLVITRFEGVECMNYSPFIYAYEQKNIAITGEGILDGQADSTLWWPWTGKEKDGWKAGMPCQLSDREAIARMGDEGIPVQERIFGEGHYLRVNFIQFYKSRDLLVEGVTLRRSPMWVIHPVLCENVTVRKVRITSHGPNNDGCNPESSRNVVIEGCSFDTGDDCIAIKSGRNGDGRRVNVASENIIIKDCVMKDGHGGVSIGSEISGSCRNVFIQNCRMDSPNLERALRIKTNSHRGGVIENIYMRNVTVGQVSDAIIGIHFNYEEGDTGPHTPIVRNIFIDHVTSKKSLYALYLHGYERSPIQNISLSNCSFKGVLNGNFLQHVQDLKMKRVFINGK
jgi:polygalacturonase